MICFARYLLEGFSTAAPPIRLSNPQRTIVVYGCRNEKIDALTDAEERIVQLVIHTRTLPRAATRRKWWSWR